MGLGIRVNRIVDKYSKKYELKGYRIFHLQLERSILQNVLDAVKAEENEIVAKLKEGKIYEEGFLESKILSSEDKLRMCELFELKKPKL